MTTLECPLCCGNSADALFCPCVSSSFSASAPLDFFTCVDDAFACAMGAPVECEPPLPGHGKPWAALLASIPSPVKRVKRVKRAERADDNFWAPRAPVLKRKRIFSYDVCGIEDEDDVEHHLFLGRAHNGGSAKSAGGIVIDLTGE